MSYRNNKYVSMKAFLIARVSDPSQIEALPGQILRLKKYADQLGLDGELFSFDETAYKEDRRRFREIVDKIARYKGKRIAVFDKIDRFTRDASSDIVRIMKEKVKEGNLELHFPSDGLIFHQNSPACDKTRLGMGMVFGEYYSAATSDNVKRSIDLKISNGEYPEKAPLGYCNVTIDGKKEIIIDKMREPFIRKAFELRLSGMSVGDIAEEMRKLGLTSNMPNPKPVCKAAIAKLFTSKFYYGIATIKSKEYQHKYERYITKDMYDEIQRISNANYSAKFHKKTRYEFAFRGILKCGVCGCSMSSYTKKGRVYMRCSNAKGKCPNNATEADAIKQLEPALTSISIGEGLAKRICDEMNRDQMRAKELRETQKKALRDRYETLERRKDILYEDRLDGRITVDEYDEKAKNITQQMQDLDDELVKLEQGSDGAGMTIANLLKLAANVDELFKSSKPAVKNQILRLVVSNLNIQQKRLNFHLLEPFATLVDLDSRSVWCPRLDLNQHVLRHMLLRHTCIPISPLGQYSDYSTYSLFF